MKAKKKLQRKKAPVKVTITRKILGKAPEQHSFNLHDGRKLETVYELIDELETMSEETFKEYVKGAENHFANWVQHVFDEKHLAEELRRLSGRLDHQRAILKHLVKTLLEEAKR